MNYAICDDDKEDALYLKDLLTQYAANHAILLHIDYFSSGAELLQCLPDKEYFAVFLDIYMNEMNGIEIAKKITTFFACHIIFISSFSDFALEAFNLNAVHYLLKPVSYDTVEAALKRCEQRSSPYPNRLLSVKVGQQTISIPQHKILYIEVSNKISYIYTNVSCIKTYRTLDSIASELDGASFLRPHRSYIVNMFYVDYMDINEIHMTNKSVIPVSRSARRRAQEEYEAFLFQLVRKES